MNVETPIPGDSALCRRRLSAWGRFGNVFFNVRGQHHFKSRFRPRFEPRYLCVQPRVTWGSIPTSGIESLRDGAFRKDRGGFRVQISNDGWNWPTGGASTIAQSLATEKKLFGKKLQAAAQERGQREIQLASLIEQLPNPANRVIPSAQKDALGIPRPELYFQIGDYEQKGLDAAKQAHALVFGKLQCEEIHHREDFEGAGHIMGTVRMGTDKTTSVVDADGKSHDHANFYVVGSSVFPSVGTANPTLTLAALALKTAAKIGASLA